MDRQQIYHNLSVVELKKKVWTSLADETILRRKETTWITIKTEEKLTLVEEACKLWTLLKLQSRQGQVLNICHFLLRYIADSSHGWLAFLELISGEKRILHEIVNLLVIKSLQLLSSEWQETLVESLPQINKKIRICLESLGLSHEYEKELPLAPVLLKNPVLSGSLKEILSLFGNNQEICFEEQETQHEINAAVLFPGRPSKAIVEEDTAFWQTVTEGKKNVIIKELEVTVRASPTLQSHSPHTITPYIEIFPGFYNPVASATFYFPEHNESQEFEAISEELSWRDS